MNKSIAPGVKKMDEKIEMRQGGDNSLQVGTIANGGVVNIQYLISNADEIKRIADYQTNIVRSHDDNVQAQMDLHRADEERSKGNLTIALQHYANAVQKYRADGNNFQLAKVLMCMSILESILVYRSKKAAAYESEARALFFTVGDRLDQKMVLDMARISSRWGHFVAARQYYDMAKDKCLENKDNHTLAIVYRLRGILESKEEHEGYEIARQYLLKSKQLYFELRDIKGQGQICQAMGDMERERNNYSEAVKHYNEAWQFYEVFGNHKWKGIIMGELYRSCTLAGMKDEAAEWKNRIEAFHDMPEQAKNYVDKCIAEILMQV
jgi:tetratricopeptide (TPR) repeat protein